MQSRNSILRLLLSIPLCLFSMAVASADHHPWDVVEIEMTAGVSTTR